MTNKLFALALIVISLSCTKSIPRLYIDTTKLGMTIKGNSENRIVLYNKGDENLVIEKCVSSCNCTILNITDSTIIPPKDSMNAIIKTQKIDTNKLSQEVIITLKTNGSPRLYNLKFLVK